MFNKDISRSDLYDLKETFSWLRDLEKRDFFRVVSAINYLMFEQVGVNGVVDRDKFLLQLSSCHKDDVKNNVTKLNDQNVISFLLDRSSPHELGLLDQIDVSDAVEYYFEYFGWNIKWLLERPNGYRSDYSYHILFCKLSEESWQNGYSDLIKNSLVLSDAKPSPNKRLAQWKDKDDVDYEEDHGDYSFVQIAGEDKEEHVIDPEPEEDIYDLEI